MYEIGGRLDRSGFGKLMQSKSNRKLFPDIIIIPGIVFSINEDRLSFVTCHYDQYFAEVKSAKNITK